MAHDPSIGRQSVPRGIQPNRGPNTQGGIEDTGNIDLLEIISRMLEGEDDTSAQQAAAGVADVPTALLGMASGGIDAIPPWSGSQVSAPVSADVPLPPAVGNNLPIPSVPEVPFIPGPTTPDKIRPDPLNPGNIPTLEQVGPAAQGALPGLKAAVAPSNISIDTLGDPRQQLPTTINPNSGPTQPSQILQVLEAILGGNLMGDGIGGQSGDYSRLTGQSPRNQYP